MKLQILFLLAVWPVVTASDLHSKDTKFKKITLNTVCIDPGHGGKDPGCLTSDKKLKEKDIVLSIALHLKKIINTAYPEVNVIMTRDDDTFVELAERANLANKNNAQLFISIHVNAADPKTPAGRSANGFSVHTLGQSSIKNRDLFKANMELCRRENSVILLEDDHTAKYQGYDPSDPESFIFFNLMQNANWEHSLMFAEYVDTEMKKGPVRNNRGISQDPFLVLWKTKMPSVLIETAFISNDKDRAVLASENGRKKIAGNIFSAFSKFKKKYDGTTFPQNGAEKNEQKEKSPKDSFQKNEIRHAENNVVNENKTENIYYAIQVMAGARKLSEKDAFFKSNPVIIIKSGSIYKYLICPEKDKETIKNIYKKIKKTYKDCFIVKVENNNISRE